MLSKTQLKNMFLIKLEQRSKPGSGVSHGADAIIPSLNQGNLTEEEKDLAWEGFEELKREGLIIPDPKQSHSQMFTKFTITGKKYFESIKDNVNMNIERFKVEFSDLINDEQLRDACQSDFESGDEKKYWNAVNNAMRHLEVRVREKASLPNGTVGVGVMTDAFNKNTGKLILTCCNTDEEREGFNLILMGLMKFHRNPKAHHEGKINREDALKIVGYVDYILSILDCATRERPDTD